MEKISYPDFKKVDLRIGQIKSVKIHPNAERLYILVVDLGKGEHDIQLVAGLRQHYQEEELIGKKVVVVRNLEPHILRGVESQGMLLAAVFQNNVSLIQPDKDIETGAKVE